MTVRELYVHLGTLISQGQADADVLAHAGNEGVWIPVVRYECMDQIEVYLLTDEIS